ncbi:G-type lectin S-receptor-like serine/threonine-protein kinase LECRK3 [Solanum stenotomum]|uniref:G-type lectin S-receptor-like serine/threonine-protein kinase LECRK3 n=1 Tax=Solanum stenotomum TaxID=172797 RepID=UPI0020D146A5|nr:G-type lectin S-receptor-like serine/threonine-protein kinase LECRK3 [Solanum stenotomum]
MRISLNLIAIFLLLILHHKSNGQNNPNITTGSTFTAGENGSLLSSSGDFAFGFYPISDTVFLVGIWFNKIQERTLVWSANRDGPAEIRSTISLTNGGLLVLNYANSTVQQISNRTASLGTMQDDGNLVLRDSSSNNVWESFNFPTDTLLPGQTLLSGGQLYSNSISDGNSKYCKGKFRLDMQADGKLVLSAYHFGDTGYWLNSLDDEGNHEVKLVFDQRNASLYLVKDNNNTIFSFPSNVPTPVEDYYHRATIGSFGNFQQYAYHKTNDSNWFRLWKILSEPCMVNAVCGAYGLCSSNDNETVSCDCLPGFVFLDPSNPTKGCHPETIINFCADHLFTGNFTIEAIQDSDMPYNEVGDYEIYRDVDEEECKKVIREDCYAMAASLINRESKDGIQTKKKTNTRAHLTAGLLTTSSLTVLFGALALYYHPAPLRLVRREWNPNSSRIGINFREFTYKELHEITNGFSKLLGKGASAKVYYGNLKLKDVQVEIAVKLMEDVAEPSEKVFMTELKIIGRTHHKNLVKLLGFCIEDNQFILVYELMKNGALSDFLFKEEVLPTWSQRTEMALGIARGLLYLHEGCDSPIIHCDIKPQNVLLDSKYNAKISDFGLSKLLQKDQTRTDTSARGTVGYLAPEWLKNAPITPKVDIFSFGVMLLEITCGRRHIELSRVEEESEDDEGDDLLLVNWVSGCVRSGRIDKLARSDPEVLNDIKRFERFVKVGLWCVHPDPIVRPSMKMVMQMLEGITEVEVPPMFYH